MNEITQVHLGRMAFTIAVDAHAELRTYLAAIKKRAGSDVQEEIELRMAELLFERGISGEKVVLLTDVAYLKTQLGEPIDFADEEASDDADENPETADNGQRKLYRNMQNGWLGGVASGIASYLGISATLVRIGFILLTFAWGASIIVYLLLWLLLPDAKSPSDILRMQGKPVNVDTIKEFVKNQAGSEDMRETGKTMMNGTWHETPQGTRVGNVLAKVVRVGLAVVGVGIMLGALTGILATIGFGTYWIANPADVFNGVALFPVGSAEVWLAIAGLLVISLMGVLLAVAGLSLVREKWPMPAWVTGSIIAIIFVGMAVLVPVAASKIPELQRRHDNAYVTTNVPLVGTFKDLLVEGQYTSVVYQSSETYGVLVTSYGKRDLSPIKATVGDDEVLTVRVDEPLDNKECGIMCGVQDQNITITVLAPEINTLEVRDGASFASDRALTQSDITILAEKPSSVMFNDIVIERAKVFKEGDVYGLTLSDMTTPRADRGSVSFSEGYGLTAVGDITYEQSGACESDGLLVSADYVSRSITVNGQTFNTMDAFVAERSRQDGKASALNCIQVIPM